MSGKAGQRVVEYRRPRSARGYAAKSPLMRLGTEDAQAGGAGRVSPAPLPRGERGVWGSAPKIFCFQKQLPRRVHFRGSEVGFKRYRDKMPANPHESSKPISRLDMGYPTVRYHIQKIACFWICDVPRMALLIFKIRRKMDMKPTEIDLRRIQRYDENPLVEASEIKSKQKTVRAFGTGSMVDTITGEIVAGTAIVVRKKVDDEHFVKVFAEGVKASFDLSPSGFKVFQLVLKAAQNGGFRG